MNPRMALAKKEAEQDQALLGAGPASGYGEAMTTNTGSATLDPARPETVGAYSQEGSSYMEAAPRRGNAAATEPQSPQRAQAQGIGGMQDTMFSKSAAQGYAPAGPLVNQDKHITQ